MEEKVILKSEKKSVRALVVIVSVLLVVFLGLIGCTIGFNVEKNDSESRISSLKNRIEQYRANADEARREMVEAKNEMEEHDGGLGSYLKYNEAKDRYESAISDLDYAESCIVRDSQTLRHYEYNLETEQTIVDILSVLCFVINIPLFFIISFFIYLIIIRKKAEIVVTENYVRGFSLLRKEDILLFDNPVGGIDWIYGKGYSFVKNKSQIIEVVNCKLQQHNPQQ